jgi:F-type H+-transporting ATPase subunit b
MPQINQLADVAFSQFFWLLVVLGLIYFGIGRAMLPRIQATVELRDRQIADDLAAAQAARDGADAIEAAYRARMDDSRAEALKLAAAAKAESVKANEVRIQAASQEIATRAEAGEARIRAASAAAIGELDKVAAEAARDMTERLAGISVTSEEAAAALREESARG